MISHHHKEIYRKIHAETPFGKRRKLPKHLEKFIYSVEPKSILDFGCGKGNLINTIKEEFPHIDVKGYDPCNPEFDKPIDGVSVDLLISSDVLEHVEPEFIDDTLRYLANKSKRIYHLIALSPAKLILPDGRNAHLIQETPEWWRTKFINLGYTILKEDYQEALKTPKGTGIPMLTKKYFIMAERNG